MLLQRSRNVRDIIASCDSNSVQRATHTLRIFELLSVYHASRFLGKGSQIHSYSIIPTCLLPMRVRVRRPRLMTLKPSAPLTLFASAQFSFKACSVQSRGLKRLIKQKTKKDTNPLAVCSPAQRMKNMPEEVPHPGDDLVEDVERQCAPIKVQQPPLVLRI